MRKFFKEYYKTLIICAVIIFMRATEILNIHVVSGSSMFPTFKNGDFVITSRIPSVNDGDVVVANAYDNKLVIKRIIAHSGDQVELKNDRLFINGNEEKCDTCNYSGITPEFKVSSWEVKDGEYFIAGDNRNNSKDSRLYGPVKKSVVKGKVICRIPIGGLFSKS